MLTEPDLVRGERFIEAKRLEHARALAAARRLEWEIKGAEDVLHELLEKFGTSARVDPVDARVELAPSAPLGRARAALEAAGTELSTDDLARAAGLRDDPDERAAFENALARHAHRGSAFRRTGKDRYRALRAGEGAQGQPGAPSGANRRFGLRPGSVAHHAFLVLRERDEPMRVRDIAAAIPGGASATAVSARLWRYATRGMVFKHCGHGRYALRVDPYTGPRRTPGENPEDTRRATRTAPTTDRPR